MPKRGPDYLGGPKPPLDTDSYVTGGEPERDKLPVVSDQTANMLGGPKCEHCGARRTSHVSTPNFTGTYYECGSHGNSRGEVCKAYSRGYHDGRAVHRANG